MPIRPDLRHYYRGPAWRATRERIRERAEDKCEQCGAPNGTTVLRAYTWWTPATLEATVFMARGTIHGTPVTKLPWHNGRTFNNAHFPRHDGMRWVGIQCGCAHLNGVANDNRDENLAWLCRGCHLRHDQGQHRNTRSTRKDAARPLLAGVSKSRQEDLVSESTAK
jgi:hypothetical protein